MRQFHTRFFITDLHGNRTATQKIAATGMAFAFQYGKYSLHIANKGEFLP